MLAPKVFLSYSHDSPEHAAAVLDLSKQLRHDGCTVTIDQDHLWVPEGWTLWMKNQIEQADFVLVVCTETYQRRAEGREDPPTGAGASWEGAIVRLDLYEANGRNRKFIPVLMSGEDKIHRPFFLRDYSYFLATSRDGYAKLCQVRPRRPARALHDADPVVPAAGRGRPAQTGGPAPHRPPMNYTSPPGAMLAVKRSEERRGGK